VWPWQWRSGDPTEYIELPPPGEHLALPGERWCDVVHRRERYRRQVEVLSDPQRSWTIDDAITENLDLPELLRDYLSQLADAAECEAAFAALRSLTVCDPTVGSGAFLFAALDVLEPLYSEVLARAEELEARGQPVPSFLAEARTHPSSRYWLLKTICLHNLFGVDLMRDAPEIAKLRLFLKLAAQIEDVAHLEPLPDLDFNIKCGNLLVGIASAEDAQRRLFSHRLDHVSQLEQVEDTARHIADAFDSYIAAEADDTGELDHSTAKQELQAKLQAARGMADTLLYEMRDEDGGCDHWASSHQPFHWFVEFPSVWRDDGFDVIIGNPPYIKASKVTGYRWIGYETQKCPDLYATCMERASGLLNERGRFAMIVMHSLCFSRHFQSLRTHLAQRFASLSVSSFSRIPGALFGGEVRVRNSIAVGSRRGANILNTTPCHRWPTEARDRLFGSLEYGRPESSLLSCGGNPQWPLADRSVMARVFAQLCEHRSIDAVLESSAPYALYFKKVAQYSLNAYVQRPPIIDKSGNETFSPHDGVLHFRDEQQRDIALVILVGRWAYLWWMMYGDEFNVTRGTLAAFPGDIERLAGQADSADNRAAGDIELESLLALSSTLQSEMPKQLAWKANAGVKVGRYNMAKLRHLTDRADWLLAQAWGIEDAFEAAGNLRDRMIFGNKD